MAFSAVFDLTTLDGTNGFRITGGSADGTGQAVAGIGDFNGDGFADFIVTTPFADPLGRNAAGAAYIIFGTDDPWSASFALGLVDGTNGLVLAGSAPFDQMGYSAAAAGDFNGDGMVDVIVGARYGQNSISSGAAYVVFGTGSGTALIDMTGLAPADGVTLWGEAGGDQFGFRVTAIGDINGDGLTDVLVGAKNSDRGGTDSGIVMVVFGDDTPGGTPITPADVDNDPSLGFVIGSQSDFGVLGSAAAGIGDINGDGFDDFAIGAPFAPEGPYCGQVFVVFGTGTGGWAGFDVADLDGTNGFTVSGVDMFGGLGRSVAGIGDFNGDGLDDMMIGASNESSYAGAAYVIFGTDQGFDADVDPEGLDGTNGFKIPGLSVNDYAGWWVTGVGDVNGDGLADAAVGALGPAGNRGAAYIIFGTNTAQGASFDLTSLNGSNGFVVYGETPNDLAGRWISGAGDINGDGIDDLLVGAFNYNAPDGRAYVIFGQSSGVVFNGGAGDDVQSGGTGADTLNGGGGKDTLNGLDGNDQLDGGDANDVLIGGAGVDDIVGGLGNDWLQGDDGNDLLSGGDGADKLFGGDGDDTLAGGAANDRFEGGAGSDTLDGGDANDYLDGGTGADGMTGGLGNDVYLVDDFGDTTTENPGEGFDIVRTSLDGWVLADNVEGLELQGSADIDGQGNSGSNNLQGNSGNNTLFGAAGVDTINGNDGDDEIIGGLGNDLLRGGTGADAFIVNHAFGTPLETDQVYDFSAAEGDYIDLSGAFGGTIVLVSSFTKHAGEMTLTFAGGITTLRLDTTGDGKVDYQMKINGDVTGESGDWLL